MNRLDADELLTTARQLTGLADFGPSDFMEGFTTFVTGVSTEAMIRPDCWSHLRERILRLLMNRLWCAKDIADHPGILQERVDSPAIIVSLPRTGSTKLHRMVGAAGGFKTTPFWMVHMFARIPGLVDGGKARRIEETMAFEAWMYQKSPGLLTGHPMFTHEPEEDQFTMEHSFRHALLFGTFHSPTYARWLTTTDMAPAYDYLSMQIKYLQWQFPAGGAPWLLKAPPHMGNEAQLARIFDAPRLIVTHRDPVKCIPSVMHTAMASRKVYSDLDSSAALRPGILGMFAYCADQHLKWRADHPEVQILDLSFREIAEQGVATARKVYDFVGLPFTAQHERNILQWERDNPKDMYGKINHAAAAIGSSEEEIKAAFAAYRERFAAFI